MKASEKLHQFLMDRAQAASHIVLDAQAKSDAGNEKATLTLDHFRAKVTAYRRLGALVHRYEPKELIKQLTKLEARALEKLATQRLSQLHWQRTTGTLEVIGEARRHLHAFFHSEHGKHDFAPPAVRKASVKMFREMEAGPSLEEKRADHLINNAIPTGDTRPKPVPPVPTSPFAEGTTTPNPVTPTKPTAPVPTDEANPDPQDDEPEDPKVDDTDVFETETTDTPEGTSPTDPTPAAKPTTRPTESVRKPTAPVPYDPDQPSPGK